ncbi:MAG: tRNA (guanine(10)-N(2))-dimethyltransferase [Candidatus Methanogasteraceae archaeon]
MKEGLLAPDHPHTPHTSYMPTYLESNNKPEGTMAPEITEDNVTVETGEAFYNPHMRIDREITIASLAAFSETIDPIESYVDSFAATGIRGLRAASKLGISVTLNDIDPDVSSLIRRNIVSNDLQSHCEAANENANTLLHRRRFDAVDLDPFGSPAPYLAAASHSVRKMLLVTATDTAPLCGAHLKSGIRKYACVPINNEYHAEIGVRVMLGSIARALAVVDGATIPLLAYARRHYVRVYVRVLKRVSSADDSMKKLGFIVHCPQCSFRRPVTGLAPLISGECPICGSRMQAAGPLWLGRLHDYAFSKSVLSELNEKGSDKHAIKLVEMCRDEIDAPTFYDYHRICHTIGISPIPIDLAVDKLRNAGFEVSRTHFSGTALKTDADIRAIIKVLSDGA